MERVEAARHNRVAGHGWYEGAPMPLNSDPPSVEERGRDPTPAEAAEHPAQQTQARVSNQSKSRSRATSTRLRKPDRQGNKRPRTEEDSEPNSAMADTQPEFSQGPPLVEIDTNAQTMQATEGPCRRSKPSVDFHIR
ncbi:uncharacterized protein ASPGLDRAFT_33224 [Aspergillus glaucus CBS 516.65]|uniref:Uncharacterized protein n=1 Tax=Aspergillus glaucus CBS 516.65 TaxID=1160497 RepID=A0A1L9VQW3_ASPGL|nr:hypothetical protein ASPGLDRAFT_33224 [Aspergillus glaucus CBS 516.65]OJJ86303.1 hypothetical protein ASPGLDRAFT_33224 [Aspergillus glaucus CBS 516.65]